METTTTSGNTTINIDINTEGSSNITVKTHTNSDGRKIGQATHPPVEEPDLTTTMSPMASLQATAVLVSRIWNDQRGRNSHLETVLWVLNLVGFNIGFLQHSNRNQIDGRYHYYNIIA